MVEWEQTGQASPWALGKLGCGRVQGSQTRIRAAREDDAKVHQRDGILLALFLALQGPRRSQTMLRKEAFANRRLHAQTLCRERASERARPCAWCACACACAASIESARL